MNVAWTEWKAYKEQAVTETGSLIWSPPKGNQGEALWVSMAASIPEGDVPIMESPLLEYLVAQKDTMWITTPPSIREGLQQTFKTLSDFVTDDALERRACEGMEKRMQGILEKGEEGREEWEGYLRPMVKAVSAKGYRALLRWATWAYFICCGGPSTRELPYSARVIMEWAEKNDLPLRVAWEWMTRDKPREAEVKPTPKKQPPPEAEKSKAKEQGKPEESLPKDKGRTEEKSTPKGKSVNLDKSNPMEKSTPKEKSASKETPKPQEAPPTDQRRVEERTPTDKRREESRATDKEKKEASKSKGKPETTCARKEKEKEKSTPAKGKGPAEPKGKPENKGTASAKVGQAEKPKEKEMVVTTKLRSGRVPEDDAYFQAQVREIEKPGRSCIETCNMLRELSREMEKRKERESERQSASKEPEWVPWEEAGLEDPKVMEPTPQMMNVSPRATPEGSTPTPMDMSPKVRPEYPLPPLVISPGPPTSPTPQYPEPPSPIVIPAESPSPAMEEDEEKGLEKDEDEGDEEEEEQKEKEDEEEEEEVLDEGSAPNKKKFTKGSKQNKPQGRSHKRKRSAMEDEPEESEAESENLEEDEGAKRRTKKSLTEIKTAAEWRSTLPKAQKWMRFPQALHPNQVPTEEQIAKAVAAAGVLSVRTTWPTMEVWDMAYQMLGIKVDVMSYSLLPHKGNGYTDVAAALWARYKNRSVRHRDWAMLLAVSSLPEEVEEAEVFIKASEFLDRYSRAEGFMNAMMEVTGKGKALKEWKDTDLQIERRYELGMRSSAKTMRLIVRQTGEQLKNMMAHVTYLIGDGPDSREHEVLGDGHCWLRCVLMQIPVSFHGQKTWNEESGDVMTGGKMTQLKRVDRASGQGSRTYGCLEKEIVVVAEKVAHFIMANPIAYCQAEERTSGAGIETAHHRQADPARKEYEYHRAEVLKLKAENYLRLNHPDKGDWLTNLNSKKRGAPESVLNLVACWSMTCETAAGLLKRFNEGEWSLAKPLGMVKVRGENGLVEFGEYVASKYPMDVFVAEGLQREEKDVTKEVE